MKKLIIGIVLSLIVLSVVLAAAACGWSTGKLQYTLINGGTEYEVLAPDGISGKVVIPETYEGLPVTRIGDGAFAFCDKLTNVVIPPSIKSIGVSAFHYTGIWNNTSNDSVVYADKWAVGIKGVISGDLVLKSDTVGIGDSAFVNDLTSITIPKSVTDIGQNAFNSCSFLTKISVAADNTVFKDTDGILFNKDGTKLICYPSGKDETNYMIPSDVTSIGEWAFVYCESLTSITIPSNVMSIGDYAFGNCGNLESVTFEETSELIRIGNAAFVFCGSLTDIVIPSSVISIGIGALRCSNMSGFFEFSSSLTSIIVEAGNTVYKDIDGILFNKNGTELISYPAGKSEADYTIPDGVTKIDAHAFSYCGNLTGITIPLGVISIGELAFQGCINLESIVIPSSVTDIAMGAFSFCVYLTSVIFEENSGLKSIGDGAFMWCGDLTSIIIPLSVESIGGDVFLCSDDFTIYAESAKKPKGWSRDWNCDYPVVWGYTGS